MLKKLRGALVAGGAMLLLAACTTTPTTLSYNPSAVRQSAPAKASVAVDAITDSRKHDANWLGAIRGGFGNPLKTLVTDVPVKDVVADAFRAGLSARGLNTTNSKYVMSLNVVQFDCNQYVRREAHARIDMVLHDRATGAEAFRKTASADLVVGDLITMDAGIFAEVEDLRKVANDALQQAVDMALDDPAFVRLVR
ncbi:MAG: SHOCT domain-containing protein [Magnetospirillum gryphiswaldense]|nr:SHOCT domain-containing protein [Magnetospirillum gryphiswaldense]